MHPIKTDLKARRNANKQSFCLKKPRFIVIMAIILSFICVQSVPAQKILEETGFENHTQPHENSPFQLSTKTVKNGKKSLEIFSEVEHQLHISGHGLETNESIVSLEFWVYVERGEQSFAVSMHAAERSFDNNAGGPYIEWYDGDIRYHVHRGDPWREIVAYPVNKWHYVRIVANFREDVFDFYTGGSREAALTSRPKRNLDFQDPATAPRPKWFLIFAWAMDARGYIDDLLIYEGDEPITLGVEPAGKLTTRWGQLKRR